MKFFKVAVAAGIIMVISLILVSSLWLVSVYASVRLLGPSWHQGVMTEQDWKSPALAAVDVYVRANSVYHEGLQDSARRADRSIVTIITWSDGDVSVFLANGAVRLLGADGLPWPLPGSLMPVMHGPRSMQPPSPMIMFALQPTKDGGYVCRATVQGRPEKSFDYSTEGVIIRVDVLRIVPLERQPSKPKDTKPGTIPRLSSSGR